MVYPDRINPYLRPTGFPQKVDALGGRGLHRGPGPRLRRAPAARSPRPGPGVPAPHGWRSSATPRPWPGSTTSWPPAPTTSSTRAGPPRSSPAWATARSPPSTPSSRPPPPGSRPWPTSTSTTPTCLRTRPRTRREARPPHGRHVEGMARHQPVPLQPVIRMDRVDRVDQHDPTRLDARARGPPRHRVRLPLVPQERPRLRPRPHRGLRRDGRRRTTGPDPPDNLAPLCRRHHRAKTHHGWTYVRNKDGTHTWTSPDRRLFTVDSRGIVTRHRNSGTPEAGTRPVQVLVVVETRVPAEADSPSQVARVGALVAGRAARWARNLVGSIARRHLSRAAPGARVWVRHPHRARRPRMPAPRCAPT